jgi:hypothetical protein
MYNPYLYDKLVQNHRQELLQEAEQRRMLAQLPQHQTKMMQNFANRFAAFVTGFHLSNKRVEKSPRMVTGKL